LPQDWGEAFALNSYTDQPATVGKCFAPTSQKAMLAQEQELRYNGFAFSGELATIVEGATQCPTWLYTKPAGSLSCLPRPALAKKALWRIGVSAYSSVREFLSG